MKKQKYKSSEHKRRELEAQKIQEALYKKWGIKDSKVKKSSKEYVMNSSYRGSDNKAPSIKCTGNQCPKQKDKIYTGTLIKGIAVTHKSNLIPITSIEQATDVAKMRRN